MIEYVRATSLRVGDILANPLYDSKGRLLFGKGNKLTAKAISYIHDNSYKGVYINHVGTVSRDLFQIAEPIVNDLLTIKIVNIIKDIYENKVIFKDYYDKTFTKDRKTLEDYTEDVYKSLRGSYIRDSLIFELEDMRNKDNSLYYHCYMTGILAMAMGINMQLPEEHCRALCLAGFYHLIAQSKQPELINKLEITAPEQKFLSEAQREAFDLLAHFRGSLSSNQLCLYGIWQSFERYDGSGYPNALEGNKVTIQGYIVGIAAMFDNLVHGKNCINNSDALEYLMGAGLFPADITRALMNVVASYNVGEKVKLSNDLEAIVIGNTVGNPLRPEVVVGYHRVNLASDKDYMSITIKEVLR